MLQNDNLNSRAVHTGASSRLQSQYCIGMSSIKAILKRSATAQPTQDAAVTPKPTFPPTPPSPVDLNGGANVTVATPPKSRCSILLFHSLLPTALSGCLPYCAALQHVKMGSGLPTLLLVSTPCSFNAVTFTACLRKSLLTIRQAGDTCKQVCCIHRSLRRRSCA